MAGTGDETRELPTYEDVMREDVELLIRTVGAPLHLWTSSNRAALDRCTAADREALILRYAITWLAGNALIFAAPDGAFERWLAADLEEPWNGDVDAKLREAVERRARFDAAAVRSLS